MARNAGRQGDPPPPPEPLPVEVADAHCHLDLCDTTVDAAVAIAASVGVTRLMTIGVDLPTSRWQAAIAAEYPNVYAAVAIHPNEAAQGVSEDTYVELEQLAALPDVRAVGETGLDYYRTAAEGRPAQQESFRRHIDIANRTGRALVIHDRDAHDDVLAVLAEQGAPDTVVIHAFSGDASFAKQCADAGYLMSFAGNVTFSSATELREAAAVVPADLLLVETDAPFLTPTPWRGRPNGSYLVPWTLRAIAEVRGDDLVDLATAVQANANRVFGPW